MEVNESSSFRDPSGFVFYREGALYRQVNISYSPDYDMLMSSGLYAALAEKGALIKHGDAPGSLSPDSGKLYKIIKPEKIPFISYPYEWSFSQLKDAAKLTLAIQKSAIEKGMCLKDASAYNIQFTGSRPMLIDTLSFAKYIEGEPWAAYGQFCRHFLAPLALMSYRDVRLSRMLQLYIDGIPLDLASGLLPFLSYFNIPILTNIHLHAKSRERYARTDTAKAAIKGRLNKFGMLAVIDGLETALDELKWRPGGTEWADYYDNTNYSTGSFEDKKKTVSEMLDSAGIKGGTAWDLGANEGVFSRIAAERGLYTVSFDIDRSAVEKNYINAKKRGETGILPLFADMTNPSPGIGWMNEERKSLLSRGPADLVLALALIHHLAISNNAPLGRIAEFFRACGRYLITEFVPKEDSQAQRLLASRKNIFDAYNGENFKKEFSAYYEIMGAEKVKGSARTIYLMRGK
jgi:hypothetical protein